MQYCRVETCEAINLLSINCCFFRREYKTEYKKKFRPFSQYDYVEGKFQKKREEMEAVHLPLPLTDIPHGDSWYREVLELRKKAGEYKVSIRNINYLTIFILFNHLI